MSSQPSVKRMRREDEEKHREQSETSSNGNLSSEQKNKCFIAVHLGAGSHSDKYKEAYTKLCETACRKGIGILNKGGTAGEAAAAATVILENSGIVNAGKGSNLTYDMTVECDAGFMDGDGYFGGAGAMPDVQNPILVAKELADKQKSGLMSGGRVPPNFLVGVPAKQWASSQQIPTCEQKDLISDASLKLYAKFMERIKKGEKDFALTKEVNDTVGAIALDAGGHVAATVSSGGNWLKVPGRIGHAPIFGCGCFASDGDLDAGVAATSFSVSGAAEMLTKVRIPVLCSDAVQNGSFFSIANAMTHSIYKKFLESEVLDEHPEPKFIGIMGFTWDGSRGEFAWGFNTDSFIVAYGTSKKNIKVQLSTLPSTMSLANKCHIQAVPF